MNNFFNIGTKNIGKYKKLFKILTLEDILEMMQSDYEKLRPDERRVVEIKVKDAINDIEKISLLGILMSLAVGVINNFYENNKIVAGIIILAFYIILSMVIVYYTRYYRVCKIYLEVIQMINQNNKR